MTYRLATMHTGTSQTDRRTDGRTQHCARPLLWSAKNWTQLQPPVHS